MQQRSQAKPDEKKQEQPKTKMSTTWEEVKSRQGRQKTYQKRSQTVVAARTVGKLFRAAGCVGSVSDLGESSLETKQN